MKPYIIAGPCSAETEAQVLETAKAVAAAGADAFRAGLWKPRTRPGSFEGVGGRGLEWLVKAGAETGLRVCTEVASAAHIRECIASGIDMVWLGARTTTNPFLVQEIADALAGSGVTVIVKNPVSPDLELWKGAVERLKAAGLKDIILVFRGVSSDSCAPLRNSPHWSMAVEMRTAFPDLRMLCDPSHMGGDRVLVPELSAQAVSLGLDGLMVEVHFAPQEALSDSRQQLSPREYSILLQNLPNRDMFTTDSNFNRQLEQFRARIDELDGTIISAIAERMAISRKIGELKKQSGVAIIQPSRWEKVLDNVSARASALGVDPEFVRSLYSGLHKESVKEQ